MKAESSGKVDYSTPGSEGYNIPDILYNDPNNRKMRVLSIGTGMSSIMNAYHLQKQMKNVEHVMYEKNSDVGGTWFENRYPGCACDIPSHAYSLNFALNPDWPRYFSESRDIWEYLNKIVEVFKLRKYIVFNTEVTGLYWQEDKGKWLAKLRQGDREFEDTCDIVLYGKGILNTFKWPDIPGMDKFKGRLVHTARWPDDYQKEQWAKDRVTMIGSGSSSVQAVPVMQPDVKHMDIFVRTGVWFAPVADNYGSNYEYTAAQKDEFRSDPKKLLEHARSMDTQVNAGWGFYYDGPQNQQAKEATYSRMKEFIKDERLLKGFTPTYQIGCRRIVPGDPYMAAIQKENVDVHFTGVERITEDGVIGEDGIERKADTIICATGFDVTFRPLFPVIGRGGVDLRDKWADKPEAYLGVAVPEIPNFLMFMGPTWPVANGSVCGPLYRVSQYAMQVIDKMQRENIKSWEPRQDVTDQFNQHAQEWVKYTIWKESCKAWYKDSRTGRLNAVWPGSTLHYYRLAESPRWEDMRIEYNYPNPWAMLGMGWVPELKDPEHSDLSPHLKLENIDPLWLEAIGCPVPSKAA